MAQRRATRREEILDTTLQQVGLRGMATTRVQDVARALGVSTSLVHYHFDSKEALMVAAFEHFATKDLAVAESLSSGSEPVTRRLRKYLRDVGPTGASSHWELWIDAWSNAQHEPRIRKTLVQLDAAWTGSLSSLIRQGVKEGTFSCPDPDASARRLISALDGLTVAVLVYRRTTRTELRRWMTELTARELGITPEDISAA